MKDQEQEQQLGDGSQAFQAGRDNHVEIHNHYYDGAPEERLQALAQQQEKIAIELWEQNAPRLAQQAGDEFERRAIEMTRRVISDVIAENPENLERLGQARAQVPLLKAQQSYGETGNSDVVPHLSGLVTQLIASEPQSYIEMISRRCVDCLTNMTSSHLNLITVVAKLRNRWFPTTVTVEMLISGLRSMLGHYIGKIPTEAIEYSYINSLGIANQNFLDQFASAFIGNVNHFSAYSVIRSANPGAMNDNGFLIADLPELAKELNPTDYFLWNPAEPDIKYLTGEFARKWLNTAETQFHTPTVPDDPKEQALVTFCQSRMLSTEQFKSRVRSMDPEMADFFDTLDKFQALALDLNPIGLMLAAQEETIRANGQKSELFEQLDVAQPAAPLIAEAE